MLMSVCMPIMPRWRTSTPTAYFSRSFTLVAGSAAMARLSSTVTMRALWRRVRGTRLPVTETDSNT